MCPALFIHLYGGVTDDGRCCVYWYLAPGSHGAYHWGFCADHRCAASSLIYDFLFPKTNGGDLSKRVRGKRGAITPGMRATDWFVAHRELLQCSALSPLPLIGFKGKIERGIIQKGHVTF